MSKITVQKCKADCEFYGNPQWRGYCSKCFQEHCSRTETNSLSSNLLGFFRGTSSPLSKKRHEEERLEAPSPHKPRSTSNASSTSRASDDAAAAENNQTNLFSYYFMLRTGKYADPSVSDQTRAFIYRIRGSKENCIHKADEVQQFYRVMGSKLRNHALFQEWEQDKMDNLIISMERFIMVNICAVVFNPSEDEERNIILQEQVKSLHWLLPKHLDFSLPSDNENTDRYLAVAQQNLLEMSKKRSPLDKLQCMVATCKAIYDLLKVAKGAEAGADEFLPVLIYVLINAAPPNLHSTIQYIDRFLPQERLMSGEMAYHFTNICCAAEFLENVRPEQLSISTDEFERYMGGHSSHLEDALSARVTAGLAGNIDRLKESEEKLRQLQNNQMKLRMNAEQLQEDLRKHHEATLAKIRTFVDQYQKIGLEIEEISNEGQTIDS